MGNDTRFLEAEDLPFRLIDVPVGSAPPPPSPPYIRKSHIQSKRYAPPIPPPRVEGYDAPPSLSPPPVVPKRFDQPIIPIPQRFDLPQSYPKTVPSQYVSNKTKHHRRKIRKPKLARCIIC